MDIGLLNIAHLNAQTVFHKMKTIKFQLSLAAPSVHTACVKIAIKRRYKSAERSLKALIQK
jgi:hypothetical protein